MNRGKTRRGGASAGRSALFVGVVLAAVLLALAVPRAAAWLNLTVGRQATDLLWRGEMPTAEGIQRALSSREAALRWLELPRARKDLGIVHLRLALAALREGDRPGARGHLERAVAELEAGLARDPVDPWAWNELAWAHAYAGRDGDAVTALAMSYRTGPFVPPLAFGRVRLALVYWDRLPDAVRGRALRDLLLAHRRQREELEAFAGDLGLVERLRRLLDEARGGYAF